MLTNKENMKNLKRMLPALAGLTLLGFATPHVSAWNGTGHMVVAEIAYNNLSPKTKAAVDALLSQHRDYALWISEMPAGYTDKPRWAFMKAATWPDDIRKTPDDRPLWHYIDLPGQRTDPRDGVTPKQEKMKELASASSFFCDTVRSLRTVRASQSAFTFPRPTSCHRGRAS